jgi:hypothetical protein
MEWKAHNRGMKQEGQKSEKIGIYHPLAIIGVLPYLTCHRFPFSHAGVLNIDNLTLVVANMLNIY